MPGIQRYSHAYREAYEQLYDYQLGDLTASFVTRDQGLKIMPGDVFPITHSIGFSAKPFRCVSMPEPVDAGRWKIQAREFDPAKYSTAVVTGPTFADTSLATPLNPPTVTGLALTEIVEAPGPGGVARSSISAAWTAVIWPFLVGYKIYVQDDAGNTVLQDDNVVGNTWKSTPLPAPQLYTVYVKARSSIAVSATPDYTKITLSGSTQSLTLISSTPILAAGATFANYDSYTLYPGDPYLRVVTRQGVSFASQFSTDTISAVTGSNMVINWNLYGANYNKNTTYVATAAVDTGAVRDMTARVVTPTTVYGLISIQVAPTSTGPWTTYESASAQINGRWVRARITVNDAPRTFTLPDGSTGIVTFGDNFYEQDLGGATLQIYGATVEETGTDTTSASGPVTVTLANKYAALRDLQVTAVQSGGTAVVTADAISLSTTLTNTFQINATVSGARVAVPVRWNFKGAL